MPKLLCLLAAAACVVPLAACGSSGHVAAAGQGSVGLELARCMRAHGVPSFPDPTPGKPFEFKAGIDPRSPSVQAAQSACKRYLPSFPAPGSMSASERTKAFAFANCMRAHGQSDFPDPTIGTASLAATGHVLALRGMFFAIPANFDPRAPAFRQAAHACGLGLPPV